MSLASLPRSDWTPIWRTENSSTNTSKKLLLLGTARSKMSPLIRSGDAAQLKISRASFCRLCAPSRSRRWT